MTARVIIYYRKLAPFLEEERSNGRTIAVANGCFDLLHVGHVRLIAAARREADVLVIALNTDESIRAQKGSGRPRIPLLERAEILAALEGVTYVTSFGEKTADSLLATLRPDVQIKGTDWTPETVAERETARSYGGRIAICGDPKNHSSTDLIRGGS
jgi:rfaE bifunctional protein nucleotidyltransferase chain/domain